MTTYFSDIEIRGRGARSGTGIERPVKRRREGAGGDRIANAQGGPSCARYKVRPSCRTTWRRADPAGRLAAVLLVMCAAALLTGPAAHMWRTASTALVAIVLAASARNTGILAACVLVVASERMAGPLVLRSRVAARGARSPRRRLGRSARTLA
jgi:hypothetical protein